MTSNEEAAAASLTPHTPAIVSISPITKLLGDDRVSRHRFLRLRITDVVTGQLKVGLMLPAGLVSVAMRMGARFVPAGHSNAELLDAFERGESSMPLVFEDVENGELVEISIEG